MMAGLLLLTLLSAILCALAAALAGAPLPLTFLAYALGGNMGLLAAAALNGRHVAARETTTGHRRG
jgi:hypothetical protein